MSDQPQTSPPAPDVPKKPINSRRWALVIILVPLLLFVVVEWVGMLRYSGRREAAHSSTAAPAADVARSFDRQAREEAERLAKQRDALAKTIDRLRGIDFSHLLTPLPECNAEERAALGGSYYVTATKDGQPVRLA